MIEAKWSDSEIEKIVNEKMELINQAIIRRMSKIGEEAVNRARTVGNYTDRTARLRNSIGYVLVANGRIVNQYFPNDAKPNVKDPIPSIGGAQTGKTFAESKAMEFTEGYVLIVVAGMEYALNVESKNYDVLSSTKNHVQLTFEEQMQKLLENIKKS